MHLYMWPIFHDRNINKDTTTDQSIYILIITHHPNCLAQCQDNATEWDTSHCVSGLFSHGGSTKKSS